MKLNKYLRNFKRSKKNNFLRSIVPKNLKKMPKWKIALFYLMYAFIGFVFVCALLFAWFAKDLPTPSRIASRRAVESTKIYDRNGETLLYETGEQKRTIVKSDQIAQSLKDATIATEDAHFYDHHGFDSRAIFSALVEKVTGKRQKARGGSTITQQYVKNALLDSNRSLTRKIKELILSIELEAMYSKDDILTMYLNEIPYGGNTAGAEAGARMYYGKSAKDLTLSESATMAAIPRAPTYYSPYGTHTKELEGRKNYVLDRMVETGKISREDGEKAKAEDSITIGVGLQPRHNNILAPHFAMYVLQFIADQYGEEQIQKQGLKIITTLDMDKQKTAEEAVAAGMPKIIKSGGSNAALAAVDPKTGQVVAMIGSRDYFDTTIDGNVNVADSLRQPGSSFKPFEYATAMKKKEYSPSKIIFDVQTDFGGGYVPRNYNGRFNGPVTMRHALANSLNIPAIKTLSLAGMDNTIRTAEDMGVTTLTDKDRYGLSLAIGVAEVKPIEMAGAFGVFGNEGNKADLTPIIKVTDSQGKILYDFDKDKKAPRQVLDPQIAYQISDILKDNQARSATFGSRSALFFPNREVAVKTGTTQEDKDAWTVGYTPSLAVAIWSGNNQPSPMRSGGEALSGPIFHTFIEKALANVPNEPFKKPEGIQTVTVEKYSNKLPTELSQETTTDIFASWQVPTDRDDVHKKLKVCKVNGKLAPKDLPEGMIEEKIFSIIHSERPDNPNWENPVRSWLEGAGLANLPPTEYCSVSDSPGSITITSPAGDSTISDNFDISASVSASVNITSVDFYLDNIAVGTDNTSPYSIRYTIKDPVTGNLSLSDGSHTISATAMSDGKEVVKNSITINVQKVSTTFTITTVSASPGSTVATVTWTTNLSGSSKVTYAKTAGGPYSESPYDGNLITAHSVALSGLTANTKYYYKVVSSDINGVSYSSLEYNFTTLP